jgi:hypothetical protein
MPRRTIAPILLGVALATTAVLDGQSPRPSSWSVPRTADGRPDFQGVWANNGMTPLERPKQFGLRATMTDAEFAEFRKKTQTLMDGGDAFFADELVVAALDGKEKFSSADTQVGNYDQSWLSDRVFDNRTSLIIDPPDGRIPPLAPGAAERARERDEAARRGRGPADAPSDLSLGTRCISYGTPNIRAGYQSYFAITQGPGVVALRSEMIHDSRIFAEGRPHISPVIRQYHGDSTARWDGDTLVVNTTSYTANATRVGATDKLKTIEKFKRVSADTLEYYVTFDDPSVWSRPWTLMIPLKLTGERMFEFACHEGNYGLEAILRGARVQERQK